MDQNMENAFSVIAGSVLSGAAWYQRLDFYTQRQIDRARSSATAANDKIDSWLVSSDFVRLHIPTVRDVMIGLAYAAKPSLPPQTVPNLNEGLTRPNLAQESAVRGFQWPPRAGEYDANGRSVAIGELTTAAVALTFQEVHAALLAFTQPTVPTADGLTQIFRMIHALISVATSLGLTLEQYAQIWLHHFTQTAGPQSELHQDPSRPPTASSLVPGVTITPLTTQSIPGYPYANRNTDANSQWRITTTNPVPASTPIASIAFAQEYRARREDGTSAAFLPTIPLLHSHSTLPPVIFIPYLVSPTGFQLVTGTVLPANSSYDVQIPVIEGQPTGTGPTG